MNRKLANIYNNCYLKKRNDELSQILNFHKQFKIFAEEGVSL